MKESLWMYFNWVSLAAFVLQDSCWENGIFPIFIEPERGRRRPAALSLGRVGFHCSLAGNISSSRMLCLSEAYFLFLVLTNTVASIRCAVSLPLLDGPHAPSLSFSPSPTQSFFFLPLFPPCVILAVVFDLVQWDAVLGLDPPPRRGLSRGEGQTGMGDWAGGGEEEGSQAHRNGERKLWWLCVRIHPQLPICWLSLPKMNSVGLFALDVYSKQSGSDAVYSNPFICVVAIVAGASTLAPRMWMWQLKLRLHQCCPEIQ